jgi:hypothetical protein
MVFCVRFFFVRLHLLPEAKRSAAGRRAVGAGEAGRKRPTLVGAVIATVFPPFELFFFRTKKRKKITYLYFCNHRFEWAHF